MSVGSVLKVVGILALGGAGGSDPLSDGDIVQKQSHSDLKHYECVPNFSATFESCPPLFDNLDNGKVVFENAQVAVYETTWSGRNVVLKYKINWPVTIWKTDESRILPGIVRDYYMSEIAYKAGVAPEPMFLSPIGILQKEEESRKKCSKFDPHPRALHVRYFMMEKVPYMINDIYTIAFAGLRGMQNMRAALKLGIALFKSLKTLHVEARMGHGDIYNDNVGWVPDPTNPDLKALEGRVVFIDFERSFFTRTKLALRDPIVRDFYHSCKLTQPQAEGRDWSLHDDVEMGLRVVATLIYGNAYQVLEHNIEAHRRTEDWRTNANILALEPNFSHWFSSVGDRKDSVKMALQTAIKIARTRTFEIPEHDRIIEEFQKVIDVIDSSLTATIASIVA